MINIYFSCIGSEIILNPGLRLARCYTNSPLNRLFQIEKEWEQTRETYNVEDENKPYHINLLALSDETLGK